MIKVFSLDIFATPKISVCMKNKFLTIFIYTNMYIYVHKYTNTCICIYITPFHWFLERERNVSSICRKHSLWCTLDEEKTVRFWFFFPATAQQNCIESKAVCVIVINIMKSSKDMTLGPESYSLFKLSLDVQMIWLWSSFISAVSSPRKNYD